METNRKRWDYNKDKVHPFIIGFAIALFVIGHNINTAMEEFDGQLIPGVEKTYE